MFFHYFIVIIIFVKCKELADLGGEQIIHKVQRIMSKLFEDSLLVNYTYKNRGSSTKKSFSDLKICEIILSMSKDYNYNICRINH